MLTRPPPPPPPVLSSQRNLQSTLSSSASSSVTPSAFQAVGGGGGTGAGLLPSPVLPSAQSSCVSSHHNSAHISNPAAILNPALFASGAVGATPPALPLPHKLQSGVVGNRMPFFNDPLLFRPPHAFPLFPPAALLATPAFAAAAAVGGGGGRGPPLMPPLPTPDPAALIPALSANIPKAPDSSSSSSPAASAHGWTEHLSKDGRRYYYQAETGKSQWDKPDDLKSSDELKVSLQTPWKEYTTAEGRTYWYNKLTKQSMWDIPEDIKKLKEEEEEEVWSKFETKTEAREHFKILLGKKKIHHKTKWEDAIKILEVDKRWSSLSLLARGEKKQLYSEYISQALKKSQEEDRKKRQQGRDRFQDFLNKWKEITPTTTYPEVANACCELSWWVDIDESEKDDMFQEFVEDYELYLRDQKRKRRKHKLENLRSLFESKEDIKYNAPWAEVEVNLQKELDESDLTRIDCLMVWEEFSKEGEATVAENRMASIKRVERQRRDAFRELLDEKVLSGQLHARSDWVDLMKVIVEDRRYRDMVGQRGSTPRELFEDKLDELEEEYSKQKSIVKDCVRTAGLVIYADSTFDWFHESLKAQSSFSRVSLPNARFAFESLLSKAAKKGHDDSKKESRKEVDGDSSKDGKKKKKKDSGGGTGDDESDRRAIAKRKSEKKRRKRDDSEEDASHNEESGGGREFSKKKKRKGSDDSRGHK